jgi:membrane protein YqaA with SNARE-associated domain
VPIPIEVILIPFMATNRHRLWIIATVVTVGCLAASMVGYGVGYFFFETLGRGVIDAMGWGPGMEEFRRLFAEYGFWAVIAVGIIPIPFQVAMLAPGAAAYPILWFVIAASIARGIRYYGLAALVWLVGDKAEQLWREHRKPAAVIATLAVAAVIAAVLLI